MHAPPLSQSEIHQSAAHGTKMPHYEMNYD